MKSKGIFLAILVMGNFSFSCFAAVPGIISYQGRALVSGVPFNGTGKFKFALVDSAGTTTFWSHDGTNGEPANTIDLTVTNGLYSVLLGDTGITNMTVIPETVFANADVRLRIWFDDSANGNKLLAPDQRVAAVGYALVAKSVDGGSGNLLSSGVTPALLVKHNGTTRAGQFQIDNAANTVEVLRVSHNGKGGGVSVDLGDTTNGNIAVDVITLGTGQAGNFVIQNGTSSAKALSSSTNGTGQALSVSHTGSSGTGIFVSTAQDGTFGIRSQVSGSSNAGLFETLDATSGTSTVNIVQGGVGVALNVNHTGASSSIINCMSSNSTVARIDKTGKGFFNGGTQTGGADLAEAFEVIGNEKDYEPGDVLALSPDVAGKIQKTTKAYSSLVSGVYATKPGVLLTERDGDADMSDTVPMGVVGVIPTKVTTENGPIKIGDLLVTSSTPGHAMKGTDASRMLGATIGKAMQNFDAKQGIIKVLVNAK